MCQAIHMFIADDIASLNISAHVLMLIQPNAKSRFLYIILIYHIFIAIAPQIYSTQTRKQLGIWGALWTPRFEAHKLE